MSFKWILVLLLLLVSVIFTAQNYEVMQIKFVIWSFQTSKAILIFCTFVAGIIIGWLMTLLSRPSALKPPPPAEEPEQ
jgi:uncharacterized integral membrane protein